MTIVGQIAEILFQEDPVGIGAAIGNPYRDEYQSEAKDIADMWLAYKIEEDVYDVASRVFTHWFSAKVFSGEALRRAAKRIFQLDTVRNIFTKYEGKILAIRNYKSKKKEFDINDFLDPHILESILVEVSTGESDITPAGKSFLERYFGFKVVARALLQIGKFSGSTGKSSIQEINSWLEHLVPIDTITFVERSRGNIKNGQQLRKDLLPSEDC